MKPVRFPRIGADGTTDPAPHIAELGVPEIMTARGFDPVSSITENFFLLAERYRLIHVFLIVLTGYKHRVINITKRVDYMRQTGEGSA